MPILSIFVILLLAIFATVSYFAEPSENDRKIRERLIALDRHAVAERPEEDDILKRITFSSIALLDQYLRRNALAVRVQTLLEQANVEWTGPPVFHIGLHRHRLCPSRQLVDRSGRHELGGGLGARDDSFALAYAKTLHADA